jgi:Ig-like domain from next to BRCA1 gene
MMTLPRPFGSIYNNNVLRRLFIVLWILTLSTACNTAPGIVKPVVEVVSPLDGAHFAVGQHVSMRIAAASHNQIARIEVHSAGVLVAAEDSPLPTPTYSTMLQFVPTQAGELHLAVTAIDATGQSSDAVNITIIIGTGAILDSSATTTPNSSNVATECKLSATFVTDVTIPDNTVVSAGSNLIKTWRMRNTSMCAWENGYQLAYMEGTQMGAPASIPVAPTARDASIDISVPFTAPIASGTYTSTWRMRAPDGTSFGNRVFVVVQIP